MLTSLLGIRLVLLAGSTVPTPVPAEALRALTRVEVHDDAYGESGFQLTFTLSKDKIGDYALLRSGAFAPDTRVIIGVVLGVMPEPLIDGIVHHHQLQPSAEPGLSTLTVMGRGVSVMLDMEERDENYPNQSDFMIVNTVLARHSQYVTPPYLVTPTTDFPIETQRVPHQAETDLRFLQRLAQRNGYVFYIQPLFIGVNSAYWGPDQRLGLPSPALTLNMGASSTVTSLNFSNDAMAAVGTEGSFVEPLTKIAIPIPPLPSLRLPPLAASSVSARRTTRLRSSAHKNAAQAAMSAVSTVSNSPEPVKGQGQLDTARYGHILRSRKLVGVRGVGLSYDGLYQVKRVSHTIDVTEATYQQQFTIGREGTGTLVPVLPV